MRFLKTKMALYGLAPRIGLQLIIPKAIKADTIAPNLQLTGVSLFNENIPWTNLEQKKDTNIVLDNGVTVRNFKFDGLSNWYYIPQHLSLSLQQQLSYFQFCRYYYKISSESKVSIQVRRIGLSCNQQQEQTHPNSYAPKVVEAKGYIVPKDSMAIPKSVPAGKPKVVTAGKPTVVPVNTNMHLAGIPKTVIAGTPKICTPGKDSFSLPKVVQAINRPFVAGIPEMVIAPERCQQRAKPTKLQFFYQTAGIKS